MEVWKKIPGYCGYEVSSHGHVRSYKKRSGGKWIIARHPQRILKQSLMPKGYLFVRLSDDGIVKTCRVASLVLLAFVGECPPLLEVCHNNGDKKNNRLLNLRYDTHKANMKDRSQQHGHLTESQVVSIRTCIAQKTSTTKDLSEQFGVSQAAIKRIFKGKIYQKYGGPITHTVPPQHGKLKKQGKSTSCYRGVYYDKKKKKYRAAIWVGGRGGRPFNLGYFNSEKDAARAYDEKAQEMHGAFAKLNFPDE